MRLAGGILTTAMALCLLACGQAPPPNASSASPSVSALERAETLIRTGMGRDWQTASADEKHAFALAAVVGLGFEANREELADDLRLCIDGAATVEPDQTLAQLAADCANTALRAAATQQLANP